MARCQPWRTSFLAIWWCYELRISCSRLDVSLGDGTAVVYDCADAVSADVLGCSSEFCNRYQIADTNECVWQLLVASPPVDVDAALRLCLSEVRDAYESSVASRIIVARLRHRLATLRNMTAAGATKSAESVLQPHWKLAFSGATGDDVARVVRDWGEVYAKGLRFAASNMDNPGHHRIKVGMVSSWFCNSAIGRLCGGIVEHLDRNRFEVVVCHVRDGKGEVRRDFYTEDIERWADEAFVLPWELDKARLRLAASSFDVLVYTDIGMEPFSYALSFSRLAPLQVVFWGHPTSTGVPDSIDYYLLMDAAEADLSAAERYTEQLVRLESLGAFYRSNESGQLAPDRSREAYAATSPTIRSLNSTAHVYACPQHCLKYHPDFDDVLTTILETDPLAIIIVRDCSNRTTPDILDRLRHRKAPIDRIVRVPTLPLFEYVGIFGGAHVALEPFPFGGSITTLDAFEAGTPVLAWAHQRTRRPALSASLYNILGISDCCVAEYTSDYVQAAVHIASHPTSRAAITAQLHERRHRLFENVFAVHELQEFLERALRVVAPHRSTRNP